MRRKKLFAFSVLVGAVLALFAVVYAQSPTPSYTLLTTIQVPGGGLCDKCAGGTDIDWVDPGSQRLYITDRTTTRGGGRIDVIDTQTNKLLYTIPPAGNTAEIGFAGPNNGGPKNNGGPNGILVIPQTNQAYVSDGDATIKVVDLRAKAVVAIIPIPGGKYRADEMGYDPIDHIFMVASPSDDPPLVTFINTDTQQVVGTYTYPSSQSSQHGAGLEQPVFDSYTKRFYLANPANPTLNITGTIDVFNPTTFLLEKTYITPDGGNGLVITPSHKGFTSHGVVVDILTGNIITTIPGLSSDQIWYNVGDNLIYFGSDGAAVDADTNKVLPLLPIKGSPHNVAVDPNNNHSFFVTTGVGIEVIAPQ
jgi:hypothetical protein